MPQELPAKFRSGALVTGGFGLVMLVAGAFAWGDPPAISSPASDWARFLAESRTGVLLGVLLTVGAAALTVAPLAVLALESRSVAGSVGLSAWVLAVAILSVSSTVLAAAAWRDPLTLDPSTLLALVDLHHLGTWAVSAPAAAVAVGASTAAARSLGAPWWLVALGTVKVLTCLVEVAGVANRSGWNAGGQAAMSSAYATVAWLGALLWFLRPSPGTRPAP